MIVAPAEGITEQQAAVDRMPWLERGEGGVFKAWFATIKWAMIEPHRVIRATPADTSIGRAWLFGLVTAVIFLTFGAYIPLLVYGAAVSFGPGQSGFGGLWFSIGGIATIVFGSLAVGLYILTWAGIAHGILRVTGKTAHTFRRTCHAICYSAPAGVVLAVPCCNILFGLVWWIASAAIMVKEAHKVHGARAALAVFVWPVLSVYIWQVLTGVQGFFIAG
ncbi:MAG: YIP1 family protein, partial [Planctomycetota bacterium]|nr:YIP1 family protein [Planctomycetota bacterium]